MLTRGDKLRVIKKVADFLDVGDIAKVIETRESGISFAFGDEFMHMGFMSYSEFEEHFEKVEEKVEKAEVPSVKAEDIFEILDNSEFEINTVFDKCTVVTCKLPNGFVITEYSACVSPENYDEEMGFEICYDKIVDKLWELEGYRLQDKLYKEELCPDHDDCDCHFCDSSCCDHYCMEEEEFDECLDTDLDCDDCEAFNCPYNTNR